MASAAHAGADDPLLQPEVLETVNIRVRGEKVRGGWGGRWSTAAGMLYPCRRGLGVQHRSLCLLAALHPTQQATAQWHCRTCRAVQAPSVMLVSLRLLRRLTLPPLPSQVKLSNISTAEWERLRTGIALKTFTALMTRYQAMSEAEEERKLKEARRFAKGLFFNIKEDPDRWAVVWADLQTRCALQCHGAVTAGGCVGKYTGMLRRD